VFRANLRGLAVMGALALSTAMLSAPQAGFAAADSSATASADSSTAAASADTATATATPVASAAPKAAATKPVPGRITVHITDAGFDKKSYGPVLNSTSESSFRSSITFVNDGTVVHNAIAVPGQYAPWEFTCFPVCTRLIGKGNKASTSFDIGGIGPGESVSGNFLLGTANISFTSATDCLYGNNNPAFDCTPSVIQMKSQNFKDAGYTQTTTQQGTVLLPPGSPDCVRQIIPNDGGPAVCFGTVRVPGRTMGSRSNPIDQDITVTIDDITGFDPGEVYLKAGHWITWINKGSRVQTVTFSGDGSNARNGYEPLVSPGLAPGQTWTYLNCHVDVIDGCSTVSYASTNELYRIKPTDGIIDASPKWAFFGVINTVK